MSSRWSLASIVLACACAVAACGSDASTEASHATSSPAPQASNAPAPQPVPASVTQSVSQSVPPPAGDATGNLIEHPARITDADIPPLPSVPFAPPRPMPVVRAVFVFAAKHPEVLSHVPCFCGCQGMGHRNNDDCFVRQRDAQERPIAWEPHGMG